MKRILFAALTAAALFSGGILQSLNAQNMEIPKKVSPFPVGDKLPEQFSKYFVGQAWLAPQTDDKRLNAPVSNVTFSPGCRNNWHSHTGGQLLIAVGGRGYYQEKGRPARALLPGDIVEIAEAEELFDFPLHPYTRSLISAIPIPDPILEKNKVLFTYDPSVHDYSEDKPELVDIGNNHFVYGNKKEIEEYKAIRAKGEKVKSITILDPDAPRPEQTEQKVDEKSSDAFLETPLHDTGSKWYSILSFFLPILGLIAAGVFRHFHHIRNYKACKKGAIAGLITRAVIILFFALMLVFALL